MKRYLVYLQVLALFTVTIFAIDMEKERLVRKTGWPLPNFEKYIKNKSKVKKLIITEINEKFILQYYDLKDKYKSELFQIEMKINPKDKIRKYTLTGYGIIKLIKDDKEIVMAYDLPLFDIGDLVGNKTDKYKYYTAGAAVPIIIADLDGDGVFESLYSLLEQDEKGFFIDMRAEVVKYKYKKMMEKNR